MVDVKERKLRVLLFQDNEQRIEEVHCLKNKVQVGQHHFLHSVHARAVIDWLTSEVE